MAHPYATKAKTGRQRAKSLYADGGAIDEDVDVRSKEEMPTSVGPYGLGRAMEYEKAQNDYKEVNEGKRFYDTGTRIPGQQKAKNDAYEAKLKRRK